MRDARPGAFLLSSRRPELDRLLGAWRLLRQRENGFDVADLDHVLQALDPWRGNIAVAGVISRDDVELHWSDQQRDASIEDQLRLCREHATREGWTVVESYADHAISGASLLRPGIQTLISDATKKRFDVVVSESLDRLSRDQEDIAGVFKRLSFAGVKIVTLSERRERAPHRAQGHDGRALSQGPR